MVTDEMVEKAAEAYWMQVYGRHRKANKWPDDVYGSSQELFRDGCRAALEAALSAAEPVASIIAERDALIAAGVKCCNGTPNPNLRPFDLAMSFIDSTNTARKAADMLWQEYKAEIDALRAAPPAPSVAVKAEELARQLWGYFKGDSTGGTTAMQWFDNNKSLGGPARIIELCRSALSAQVQDVAGDEEWQTVPKHPTGKMIDAVVSMVDGDAPHPFILNLYRAMLAVAPAKQEGGE